MRCLALLRGLCVLGIASAVAGCGADVARPAVGRVNGRITFQGRPVSQGRIEFRNIAAGVDITAPLDADGRYQAKTLSGLGLPPGTYQIAILPPVVELPFASQFSPSPAPDLSMLPEKYRAAETSGLTLTVKLGENTFDLDMTGTKDDGTSPQPPGRKQ